MRIILLPCDVLLNNYVPLSGSGWKWRRHFWPMGRAEISCDDMAMASSVMETSGVVLNLE